MIETSRLTRENALFEVTLLAAPAGWDIFVMRRNRDAEIDTPP